MKSIAVKLLVVFLFLTNSLFAQGYKDQTGSLLGVENTNDEINKISKLIVLPFKAINMTETAAISLSTTIAQNLINTNQFIVTQPENLQDILQREQPDLQSCVEIGCGVQVGKILKADRILVGKIKLLSNGKFQLRVELINVFSNALEFEDVIHFDDDNSDRYFYKLANQIAKNTPIHGLVLQANNKIVLISLGKKNGVKVNDRLIVYRSTLSTEEENQIESSQILQKNIAIIKITQVDELTSQGTYFQKIEIPTAGHRVMTFIDKRKQIYMAADVRKELDTYERNIYEIEFNDFLPVQLQDQERKKWLIHLRRFEAKRDLFQWGVMFTGLASMYLFSQQSDGSNSSLLFGSAIATAWTGYEFLSAKRTIGEIVQEGQYKGYIEMKIHSRPEQISYHQPTSINSRQIAFRYQWKF